jgi:hypothetical protein
MKWKSKLDEVGLTEQTASQGIRNKISDYNTIYNGINEVKEKIANPSVNDDVDDLQKDLIELTDALEEQDNVLIKAIALFDKNKDHYAKLGKNLADKRQQKAANKTVSATTPAAKVETTNVVKEQPVNAQSGGIVIEEKKKDSLSWVLLGGLALVVTLGAVNIFKNND